jgi:hypothetical protein
MRQGSRCQAVSVQHRVVGLECEPRHAYATPQLVLLYELLWNLVPAVFELVRAWEDERSVSVRKFLWN